MQMRQASYISVPNQLKAKVTSMPTVVNEIINLANDSRTSIAHLSSVLLKDSALTKSILKRANSPYYGFAHKVSTLDFAIVLLGFDVLKETVSSLLVNNALRNMVNVLFRYEEFWNHSLSCGIIASYLAEKLNQCDPDDAFVAGLLHDIGFVILHQYLNDDTPAHHKDKENQSAKSVEAVCGVTHAETGNWIAERWQLPAEIAESIRYHHTPELAKVNPALTATVHIADVLCQRLNIGTFSYDQTLAYQIAALKITRFDEATLNLEELKNYCMQLRSNIDGGDTLGDFVNNIKTRFVETMGELPEKQKVILALYYYEGLSFEEISRVLNLDETTINGLHAESLSALKNVIWNIPDGMPSPKGISSEGKSKQRVAL